MNLEQASERIEALEAEVAWLKSELATGWATDGAARLWRGWKLSPQQAAIVMELRSVWPRALREWALAERLPAPIGRSELRPSNFVKVQVHRIRKIMGEDVIETLTGFGYALAPHWVAKIDEVIA